MIVKRALRNVQQVASLQPVLAQAIEQISKLRRSGL